MLALLLLVAPLVASASRADNGDVSTSSGVASLHARGDAHIVHLCSESHRAAVGAEWPDAHHITNLPSLKALIVHATAAEVASLQADARVCAVHADRPVSHGGPPRRRLEDAAALADADADAELVDAAAEPVDPADKPVDADGNPVEVAAIGALGKTDWYDKSHSQGKPWNLDRINGELDGNDSTKLTGKGVNIFVLDTGLDTKHPEFKGSREVENVGSFSNLFPGGVWTDKPEWGWSDGKPWMKDNNDGDGHGTHVAATVGGRDYGVATGANIYAMKVLSNSGGGSESRIIAAMDAVADVVKRKKVKGPTIVSMSLGGPCADKDCSFGNDYSKAVADLRDLGVLTVIAAGNSDRDACKFAPAASRQAITVGSIEQGDRMSWFSNYGKAPVRKSFWAPTPSTRCCLLTAPARGAPSMRRGSTPSTPSTRRCSRHRGSMERHGSIHTGDCVDLVAPGSDVPSAVSDKAPEYGENFVDDDKKDYSVQDGTSQAAPLVAGTLALYLEIESNPEKALRALLNNAEEIDTRSPSKCVSNKRLVKTPGTSKKKDLDTSSADEHPCKIKGDPKKSEVATARPSVEPSLRPSVNPTREPTREPSRAPSRGPTLLTVAPSQEPTAPPTARVVDERNVTAPEQPREPIEEEAPVDTMPVEQEPTGEDDTSDGAGAVSLAAAAVVCGLGLFFA